MNMKMLPAAPGTCAMCATKHEDHMAHNFWSLFYGMRFKLKYGRDPTHADTVAHLTPAQQAAWRSALEQAGQKWTEPEGMPIREPYAESDP